MNEKQKEENDLLALLIAIFGWVPFLFSLLLGYRVVITVEKDKK